LGKHKRLARSSECFAVWLLENMGYVVENTRVPVTIDGVEISDIDIVALRDGTRYAVEVKAGSADVSSIRQAYVNATVSGMKPMIIARGVDDKARALAERLGVEIIVLPDMLYAGFDDLREAVRESLYSMLNEIITYALTCPSKEDLKLVAALAESEDINDLALKLGVTVNDAASIIARLARKGEIPRGNYNVIRTVSKLKILYCSLRNMESPKQ